MIRSTVVIPGRLFGPHQPLTPPISPRSAACAAVLGEVTTAAERFLDEVVWPA